MDSAPATLTRGLRVLAASFGLAWVASAMVVGPGSAAFVALTGRLEASGLYITVFSLAAGAGGAFGGRAMDHWGRRPVLVAAYLLLALGFAIAGLAYAAGAFWFFALGVALLALGFGAAALTRLVAAELLGPDRRGRAVAVIQASAIFGAVLGPLLLVASDPLAAWLGRDPAALVWFIGPPILLASAALAWRAPEPERGGSPVAAGPQAGYRQPSRQPLGVAVLAMAASEAAMVAVMSVTGAALVHHGHGVGVVGLVMSLHFVGMFGLSLLVGKFTDRRGRRPALVLGLLGLALGGAVVAAFPDVVGHAVGLAIIGLGWCFAYLAGTVLVTDVTPPARRARTLGLVDLGTRVVVAGTAAASGWAYAALGLRWLGVGAILIVVVPLLLALTLSKEQPLAVAPVPGSASIAPRAR